MKEVISGVVGALLTALILWVVGVLKTVEVGVPADAVLAFKSDECPDDWEAWDRASGRFLRGIDFKKEGIDPEPSRAAGSLQEESIADHDHYYPNVYANDGARTANNYGALPYHPPGDNLGGQKRQSPQADWKLDSNRTIGDETRPDNVAVLFCVKK